MKNKKISGKFVLYGITISILFFTLLLGLNISEKNTKTIGFGESIPCVFIETNNNKHHFNINLLGGNYKFNFEKQYKFFDTVSNATYTLIKDFI